MYTTTGKIWHLNRDVLSQPIGNNRRRVPGIIGSRHCSRAAFSFAMSLEAWDKRAKVRRARRSAISIQIHLDCAPNEIGVIFRAKLLLEKRGRVGDRLVGNAKCSRD